MALSEARYLYGVHSLTLYDRTTWEPFGTMRILGSLSTSLSGESNKLFGGSQPFPFATELGTIESQLSGTIREIPDMAFEKFLGASVTSNSAESSGSVGSLSNKKGSSVSESTTGIASIGAKSGSEDNLKDGLYVVKAASSTTVDIFCMSNVDFDKGTSTTFENDLLKINSSPLTVADSGGTTDVSDYGLQITGGSGTVSMSSGDTAYFYVRKINDGSSLITVGQGSTTFPEFGAYITSQKLSSGDTFDGQLYRCKANGMPLPFNEKEWLNSEVTIDLLYDSAEDAVMRYRAIKGA